MNDHGANNTSSETQKSKTIKNLEFKKCFDKKINKSTLIKTKIIIQKQKQKLKTKQNIKFLLILRLKELKNAKASRFTHPKQ